MYVEYLFITLRHSTKRDDEHIFLLCHPNITFHTPLLGPTALYQPHIPTLYSTSQYCTPQPSTNPTSQHHTSHLLWHYTKATLILLCHALFPSDRKFNQNCTRSVNWLRFLQSFQLFSIPCHTESCRHSDT